MPRSIRSVSVTAAVTAMMTIHLGAIYSRPDIEQVPVARLVANLERELKTKPKDPDIHLRLARLYAMAYAANADQLPTRLLAGPDTQTPREVWFGHEPNLVPRNVDPGDRSGAAKTYLAKSIAYYKTTVALDESNLVARIGLAWTQEQAGDPAAAVEEYRKVIAQAWPKEQHAKFALLGQRFYTEEAVRNLLPLLDPKRDAAEIQDLFNRAQRLAGVPRPITPIAIPLSDTAGARSIVDLDAAVRFDADATGRQRAWTWITAEAGWLVYDAAGRGEITSALQWFGESTFWAFWTNGYEALAALDDNGDGELRGGELRYLGIWHDANRNGRSEAGEVRPVASHGIAALSCRWRAGDGVFAAAWSEAGVTLATGRTRPSYDVILRTAVSVSAP